MARLTRTIVAGGSSPIRSFSRLLSRVRICSNKITLSLASPYAEGNSIWVGSLALLILLVTAAAIAVSGVIGWVGLVIPHLSRKLVGSDHRGLLPCSMLTGASFLLLVDDVSRNLLATEIPIGILTAVIGAPFFIYLLLRKEKTL